jgi:hypothetical protein
MVLADDIMRLVVDKGLGHDASLAATGGCAGVLLYTCNCGPVMNAHGSLDPVNNKS